jgi:polyisoprenoid-binding protein YceI
VAGGLAAGAAGLQSTGGAQVVFLAVGPAGLRIEGKTSELRLTESQDKVNVVVPLAKLDTGIGLRNRHMRDKYLEVHKYPNAELTVPRGALTIPTAGQTAKRTVNGVLRIHGVDKTVPLSYTAQRSGALIKVSGTVRIHLRDFKIDVPSYLGVTVKPDIQIDVSFAATGT